jgi:hypothetical protein
LEVNGNAPVSDGDLARARNEAVQDALRKAVEQVAGKWFPSLESGKKAQLFREQIVGRAETYIQGYRIVSEITTPESYSVTVRATVFAESVRSDLQGLDLIKQTQMNLPVSRISLTIRGLRSYGDYAKCRGTLKDRIVGMREFTLREASWGWVRFDIAIDGTAQKVAEQIQEKLPGDIQYQDDGRVEINLK